MTRTLNDYIEKLKPIQKDYIVFCVKEFNAKTRGDFHHGLLPFLSAQEAAECLKKQLDYLESVGGTGQKFIRQILSVFASALQNHRLYEDEVEEFLHLKSAKMKKTYGVHKMSGKFNVRIRRYLNVREDRLFELQMISRDFWRVTTHKDDMPNVSGMLMDWFGFYP